MCAVIETMIASTRPCASATPVRSSPRLTAITAPAPMKISANVATNSATAALPVLSTPASSPSMPDPPDDSGARWRLNGAAAVDRMRGVKVLLVSPDAEARDLFRIAVGSIERRLGEPVSFQDAADGEQGARIGLRERPDAVVADEIASRAGAFAMAQGPAGRGRAVPWRRS